MDQKNNPYLSKLKNQLNMKLNSLHLNTSKSLEKYINKFQNLNVNTDRLNPSRLIEKYQDKFQKIATNKSIYNQVILKQSKFWARSITWVLMSGTAFCIGWVAIAETEEIVIATGKLEPKSGVVEVQMPLEGVASEILVKEGEKVTKGQILIRLDTEITEARNTALRKNLESNQLILDKLALLVKEGAVSQIQYLQQALKVEDLKSEIKTNLVRLKYQKIIAPSDGMVFDLAAKGPGYVAMTSQPVLKIVPLDQLIAKIEIDSRSIGFVQEGKLAEISIDSFPASDFGVIEGKVTRISSDALPPSPAEGKGYRFPADIVLNNQYLKLKTGQKLDLQAGMSLSANIKLRKVTYLQLLLNKFTDKADSLKSI
ncbi:HlyD family secretion protein [Prochlorococcus sp. MIT 0916]|uniref:Putative transporter component n=1 Tax=Prochlorococcus marinus str. P0903-H212 TaxID=1622208 RepID=A0A0D5A441_PROMR|nr:putative transporter component [Prochlorococcus marinus str. P0903-H212]